VRLRQTLKSLLQRTGFDVVRHVPEFTRPFPVLPHLVQAEIGTGKPFYFVQIGANDGVLDDPLHDLIIKHRLPGLLVEPLPDLFGRLQANYAGVDCLTYDNVAIHTELERIRIFRVKEDASVSKYWHGLASFSKAHLLKEGVHTNDIIAVDVPATSMRKLFAKHRIDRLSLLQIDTEGYDATVLFDVLSTGVYPSIINYEQYHLPPSMRAQCKQRLWQCGYRFIDVGRDTLALRQTI
jgi:FkbM family methyltransferase